MSSSSSCFDAPSLRQLHGAAAVRLLLLSLRIRWWPVAEAKTRGQRGHWRSPQYHRHSRSRWKVRQPFNGNWSHRGGQQNSRKWKGHGSKCFDVVLVNISDIYCTWDQRMPRFVFQKRRGSQYQPWVQIQTAVSSWTWNTGPLDGRRSGDVLL